MLRGIEAGQYHLPSPDLGQNLLVAGMTSLRWATPLGKHWVGLAGVQVRETCPANASAPLPNPVLAHQPHLHPSPPLPCPLRSPKRFLLLLHVLMGPILPLVTSVYAWLMDRAAAKHNAAHGMPPRPAAAAPGAGSSGGR